MQQGDYVARILEQRIPKSEREPVVYTDRGTMATIGRSRAIAQMLAQQQAALQAAAPRQWPPVPQRASPRQLRQFAVRARTA